MKKLIFIAVLLSGMTAAKSQVNYLRYFPSEKGTQLISKTYDAAGDIRGSIVLTVEDTETSYDGQSITLTYSMNDNNGNNVANGTLKADYGDGELEFKADNKSIADNFPEYLSMTLYVSGSFLNYPYMFSPEITMDDNSMARQEVMIRTAGKLDDVINIQIYNRDVDKYDADVTTPAGEFKATKVEYGFDITADKKTAQFTGYDWFATGTGIVRSEIYRDGKLVEYTVLSEIVKP